MAVTPASLSNLSTIELNIVTRAETAIDNELRLKFKAGKPVTIRHAVIDFVFDENPRVLATLLDLYETAGWSIIDYQKDGRFWYSFSET